MATDDRSAADWLAEAEFELQRAASAWQGGNAGKGRVGARRAAGMGLKAWLSRGVRPDGSYGSSFIHHLRALAEDPGPPAAVREAGWRLAALPAPAGGFSVPLPERLTPMDDARTILGWCATAGLSGEGDR